MFTGIISDVGQIIDITLSRELNRPRIASAYEAGTIPLGASVANSGACLTVVGVEPRGRSGDRFRRRRRDPSSDHAPAMAGRANQPRAGGFESATNSAAI
jgi:hypothetical protein